MDNSNVNTAQTDGFENIPRAYVNAARVTHSIYDFQLVLINQFVNNLGDEPVVLVNPVFVAQMSPQHLKVLNQVLSTQLQKYEETFGTIVLPEGMSRG